MVLLLLLKLKVSKLKHRSEQKAHDRQPKILMLDVGDVRLFVNKFKHVHSLWLQQQLRGVLHRHQLRVRSLHPLVMLRQLFQVSIRISSWAMRFLQLINSMLKRADRLLLVLQSVK